MLMLLTGLVIVYLVVSPMWSEDETEITTQPPADTFASIDHQKLIGLELHTSGGELLFALNEDSTAWNWNENADVPLDNVVFAEIVTAFNQAQLKYKIENTTDEDLLSYGLVDPEISVKFLFSDSSSKEYLIGNYNSFNSMYYIAEASNLGTVYMVSSAVKNAIELDIYDFILEETPPAVTEAKMIDVYYTNGYNFLDFNYYSAGNDRDYTDKYNWYFVGGLVDGSAASECPLNTDTADTLADIVTGMYFDRCVGLDCSEEQYGFSESKKIILRYNADTDENGVLTEQTYVIYLGSQTEDGEIYAHTENSDLVYIIGYSDEWSALLSSDTAVLMPNEIWFPNYQMIDSMTFTADENTLTVNVKNTDGKVSFSSDASDDADALEALVESLENLKATSNLAYFEDDAAAVEKTDIFSVKIAFNSGAHSELEIKVTRYSINYCLVSFNGRNDQLITLEDAETFAQMILDFFTEESGAG